MKLLCLETSSAACSAAVVVEDVNYDRYELAERRHVGALLPMAEDLMKQAGIKGHDLDAIAFGRGPGAFTALRAAAGICQGLAWAWERPVIAISSLAILAQGAAERHDKIACAVDARMGEVYWGLFHRDGQGLMRISGEEQVCRPGSVCPSAPIDAAWHGIGSGWQAYGDELHVRLPCGSDDGEALPAARHMVPLAIDAFDKGEVLPANEALPSYIRQAVQKPPAVANSQGAAYS